MANTLPKNFLIELDALNDIEVYRGVNERERYSRDFYDYSPVLVEKLKDCIAQVVVRPLSISAVIDVACVCNKYRVPLTLRGMGTGNYGQCVPLEGGVVMVMSAINTIRKFDSDTSQLTVETGCLIGEVERYLATKGRQLRLMPSTWRSASIGGFIAGGSGGIGSVRWGFLRDKGNLLGLEIVTTDQSPRKIQLNEEDSEGLNHAYGTNGIITALTLTTTSLVNWKEITIDCKDWNEAVQILKVCMNSAVNLFLACLLEKEIIENIPNWSGEYLGKHRLLLLVDPDGVSTIESIARSRGTIFNNLGNEKTGNGFREMSWNHTTLHMRSIDSDWTYLQMLLPHEAEVFAMNSLNEKWGKSILWHLEVVRQQGVQRIAALPLIRWKGSECLSDLIKDCQELGAVIFNPHVITVEEGGLGVVDSDQVNAKKLFDPQGILNPGKLKGWS